MATETSSSVTKHIDALFRTGTAIGLCEGSLLDRFRNAPADQAEAAFAVLVEGHGSMVLHVCRRILGDRHDAEDAAQATFLVFARYASSIRRTDSVASWLYGVAARVSTRARRDDARRRLRERRGAARTMATPRDDRDNSDHWPELYEELDRLPERFRLPIVLCHLEGLTYEQAARRLGCPVRTVQSRLTRGRARLRDRLARRGLAPAIAALARDAARVAVPATWKHATVTAAVRHATGAGAAAIPSSVALLAQGAAQAMRLHRLMKLAAALFLLAVIAAGAGMGMLARSQSPVADSPHPAKSEKRRFQVTMTGSVTLEVVGVSRFPSGPKTWWRPDGTPLETPPIDPLADSHRDDPAFECLIVLVQISGLSRDANLRWLPTFDGGYSGYSPTRAGQKVPGLEAYVVSLRRDRPTCEVKVRLAAGPWKTEVSNDGRGGTGRFVNGHKFAFGKARPLRRTWPTDDGLRGRSQLFRPGQAHCRDRS